MQSVDQEQGNKLASQLAELHPRLVQGDRGAWDHAHRLLGGIVAGVVRRSFRDDVDVEEVCAETGCKVIEAVGTVRDPQAFLGWWLKLALNTAREHARRRGRRQGVEDVDVDALRAKTRSWFRSTGVQEALAALIDALPAQERTLLVLHYGEELSWREVGDCLGIREATARKRGHRLMARLKEACGRLSGEGSDLITAAEAREILQRIVDEARAIGGAPGEKE